jgi:hypothetical protein
VAPHNCVPVGQWQEAAVGGVDSVDDDQGARFDVLLGGEQGCAKFLFVFRKQGEISRFFEPILNPGTYSDCSSRRGKK